MDEKDTELEFHMTKLQELSSEIESLVRISCKLFSDWCALDAGALTFFFSEVFAWPYWLVFGWKNTQKIQSKTASLKTSWQMITTNYLGVFAVKIT